MDAKTGHNFFVDRDRKSQGYFTGTIGDDSAYLYVTSGWQSYTHYRRERKAFLPRSFLMKIGEIPKSSVPVGHWYVQHGDREWRKIHCDRYRTYLIPKNHDLPDERGSSFEYSFHVGSRAYALSV